MQRNERKNKADKKWKHGIEIFSWALLLLLFLSLLGGGTVFAYTYYHTDYRGDELLFEMAKGNRTTRLFYDARIEGAASLESGLLDGNRNFCEIPSTNGLPAGYRPKELREERLSGGETMIFCPYSEISEDLKNAFVAIEDHRFFEHHGVDWLRTARAVANYFFGFDRRFGASTITQQLIKNISSDNELTASRKLREICRALHLETHHSKEEILELYLNIVPLSEGCIGVGAASEVYFGKKACELSLAEAASIAAVTNLPRYYDPVQCEENNRARRELILGEMLHFAMIDEEEYRAALAEPIRARGASRESKVYDWYTETVINDVAEDLCRTYGYSREISEKMIFRGGLSIYTLEDPRVQETLESYFADLSHFPAAAGSGLNYAMAVVDPATGNLLGVVGSVGPKTENRILNYATAVLRAPGSALKPLSVYAPALEEQLITWGSVFDDVPVKFSGDSKKGYTAWPQNQPAVYGGLTDIADAVAYSKNTVSVRVLERLGIDRSYDYLTKRLGFDTLVRSEPGASGTRVTDLAPAPLALGQLSRGVSVRDMTEAYTAFASGGIYHSGRSYALVLDACGEALLKKESQSVRAFRPAVASIMTRLLMGVTERGTARCLTLSNTVDIAGKTGTSGDGQDKWFVGYTPYLAAGIWCGYPDGKTAVPASAAYSHLAVYDAVMKELHAYYQKTEEGGTSFSVDFHLVSSAYCRDSGAVPSDICRKDPRGGRTAIGYFERGSEPHTLCGCHVAVSYDREGSGVLPEGSTGGETVGLIHVPDRDFPCEIYVTDAQYVYRPLAEGILPNSSGEKAYFFEMLPEGHFAGVSRTGGGRQFNAGSQKSPEDPMVEEENLRRFMERYFAKIREKYFRKRP